MRFLGIVVILMAGVPVQAKNTRVLFLTHSAGFKHSVVTRPADGSLSLAETQLTKALAGRYEVIATQDCADLNPAMLKKVRVVAFYTTGELPVSQANRNALLEWIKAGGGFAGFHCATDTWYEFQAYGEMIGGYFDGHPWHQAVKVKNEGGYHPACGGLGESFEITDEIYQHRSFDRGKVRPLLTLDPASVDLAKGKREDKDYVLSWCKSYGAGRVFVTALGHREEVWQDPRFLKHAAEGVLWAAGKGPGLKAPVGRLPAKPPKGAVVLFDGKDQSTWRHWSEEPVHWPVRNGGMESKGGDLMTKDSYQDFTLHVEFKIPATPDGVSGQGRGNSGVYLQGRYEVQVLDSHGLEPETGDCGALYHLKAPDVNACLPAGNWQAYDIEFRAARFDAAGTKVANARVTVKQNGVTIQREVEVPAPTGAGAPESPAPGPIRLQDHGNAVLFRNVWIVPRAAEPEAGASGPSTALRAGPESGRGAGGSLILLDREHTDGWVQAGPGGFDVADGVATARGGMGLWYYAKRSFKDFVLTLEFQQDKPDANSGVFVRFPRVEGDPWKPVNEGYEIQIYGAAPSPQSTGALYSFQAPTSLASLKPPQEWNVFEIRCQGQQYQVTLNGSPVNTFAGTRSLAGMVGLQNHSDAVRFRNIRIKEL